ncbi:MAG: DUF4003 family protein [Clostridia bacterium]|nr:DUF4003 family protein [Clostridia bacterium]
MNETLLSKCEMFIKNRDAFKEAFPWENANFYPICAAILADENRVADVEALKETRQMLKERVSVFSNFRGNCELPIVAMLDVDSDPEWRLDDAIKLYESLKDHFFSSEYLPMAAIILSGVTERAGAAERTRRIYDLMKKEHPFLTSSEDCVFAAMLAVSEKGEKLAGGIYALSPDR